MTDTPIKMLYDVCWMKRGDITISGRSKKATSWEEAAVLVSMASWQSPLFAHWIECTPVEDIVATPIIGPRDALIAALEQEIAERPAAIKQMREEK